MSIRVFRVSLAVVAVLTAFSTVSNAQGQEYKGWPGHDDISDLKGCFVNPPKGYGNVPFYWWTGDPLDINRLNEQLEILSDASTDGLNVSYNHTHWAVDVELNANGHGPCGRVSGGEPRIMSEEWWKIWNEFSANCAKKGIGLGLDDYVIAWPKNGEFIDDILNLPSFQSYQGRLVTVKVGKKDPKPEHVITILSSDRDSTEYICTEPSPWLHPDFGKEIIARYFQPFVDHMDEEALKGMNYFFQDELQYGLELRSWSEDMRQQFKQRKGYDIVPFLGKLFIEDESEIDDEAAREASRQEIIRRYYTALCDQKQGKVSDDVVYKLEMLMRKAGVKSEERSTVAPALNRAEETGDAAAAMELPDGRIVTGKTSDLLGAASALLLNALKELGGMPHELHLISPVVLDPIQHLKTDHLGNRNPRLHTDETLIALSISAATNPMAEMAMEQLSKLRGCEVHSSVILSQVDVNVFHRLGVHLTCEPRYSV